MLWEGEGCRSGQRALGQLRRGFKAVSKQVGCRRGGWERGLGRGELGRVKVSRGENARCRPIDRLLNNRYIFLISILLNSLAKHGY